MGIFAQQIADFTWHVDGSGSVVITGYNGAGGEVIIPAEINKMPVIRMIDFVFPDKQITSVTLYWSLFIY